MLFTISFATYTLLIIAIGLYSARLAKRSDEDYFLAGRSLGPWVAALSASASSESGWVTIGLVGWAFKNGVEAYWIIPGCLFGFLFNWFVLAGRLRRGAAKTGALTLPDFFAFHFRERWPLLRVLSVIVILLSMRIRAREMNTLNRIGCSRSTVAKLYATEIALVVVFSVLLALGATALALAVVPDMTGLFH